MKLLLITILLGIILCYSVAEGAKAKSKKASEENEESKEGSDESKEGGKKKSKSDESGSEEEEVDDKKKNVAKLNLNNLYCNGIKLNVGSQFESTRRVCYKNAAKAKKKASTPAEIAALRLGKACIGMCLWESVGFLNDDFKLQHKKIEAYIDKTFPVKVLGKVNAELKKANKKCSKIEGYKEGKDATEKSCLIFKPYLDCIEDKFREICKPDDKILRRPMQQENNQGGGGLLNLNLG